MVRCTLHLYFPPGWELGEEAAAVQPEALRSLGDRVQHRCREAARAVGELSGRGWACRLGRYEIVAEKRCDRANAMLDLLRADLDPVAMSLEEFDERRPAAS